ncbi:MAG: DUF3108 domain-containing protein [Ignavibacteriales bacterium]|nr:DUF3108 domain-containing protein [Ignavibacteriales bacterium]
MKTKIIFAIIFFWLYESGIKSQSINFKIEVGEELTYVVKYVLLELGELRFKILEKKEKEGQTYYRMMVYIDSYSGVPFVDLHQIYETNYNSNHYSDYFRATHKSEDYYGFTEYKFDYANKKLYVKQGDLKPYRIFKDTTEVLTKKMQDGLSLFYFARWNFGADRLAKLSCFVAEQKANTNINFYTKTEKAVSSYINYEVDCRKLDGETDVQGVFGLTGGFEGWFSNDEHSVPIYAKLHVILGSVTCHLKSWRKSNWNPPRAK